MFYALVIAVVVPIMAWIPITLSSGALDVVIILDFMRTSWHRHTSKL